MAFFYSHPLKCFFPLALIAFAVGGAAISGIGQRATRAGNREPS